jgi:hypothetical protein
MVTPLATSGCTSDQLLESAPLPESAKLAGVPTWLHRWRREFRDGVEHAFPGLGKRKAEESRLG